MAAVMRHQAHRRFRPVLSSLCSRGSLSPTCHRRSAFHSARLLLRGSLLPSSPRRPFSSAPPTALAPLFTPSSPPSSLSHSSTSLAPPPIPSPTHPSFLPVVHHPLQQRIAGLLLSLERSPSLPLSPSLSSLLSDSRALLYQPFFIVVVGEFNSSKSSLINALLRSPTPLLPTGPLPTTSFIYIIQYGETVSHTTSTAASPSSSSSTSAPLHVITAPIPWLRTLSLIDTPGTNALARVHEQLTRDFLPRADLILLVTSSERPFSQSEKDFLSEIEQWKKRVAVVVSKVDLLANADERRAVEEYVREGVGRVLRVDGPDELKVFMVSTREEGSLAELERYVRERVGEEGVWLKLRSPLGVVERVLAEKDAEVQRDARVWEVKRDMLKEVEAAQVEYRKAAMAEYERTTHKVENVFLRMEQRSLRWIAEWGSLLRATDWLRGASQMQQRYTQEVWQDVKEEIERALIGLLDGLSDARSRHLRRVQSRLKEAQDDLEHGSNHQTLRALQASTADILASQQAVTSPSSSSSISSALSTSLFASAALNTGAVSLAVSSLLSLTVLDLTFMSSGLLAIAGLSLMPWRRRQLGEVIRMKAREMQERVDASVKAEVESEIERVERRVRRGMEGLEREVEKEGARLSSAQHELTERRDQWRLLLREVEALQPNRAALPVSATAGSAPQVGS